MEKNNDRLIACMNLASAILNKYSWALDVEETQSTEYINKVLDFAVEKTLEVKKKLSVDSNVVCCGDYVILSINNQHQEKFILYKFLGRVEDTFIEPEALVGRIAYDDGYNSYRIINACSTLGKSLLNKRVGSKYRIEDTIGKNIDSYDVEVLANERTIESVITNKYEIQNDIDESKVK